MPCTPSSNTINVVPSPPIPVPGFGIAFSPIQIPLPSFDLPSNLLEDFPGLISALTALFPSGTFIANPEFSMKTIFDVVGKVLSMLQPYLSFYNFIMALLKMITCIIEVLCAIPNPFALAVKLQKLFKECIPAFLALFPFLALILMIIALLFLILALIEYIIATVISTIELLIKNLVSLVASIELQDAQSILAITQKIASLLCFIQNILSVLIAIAAILAIIKSLSLIGGGPICGDDSECCDPSICPPFIKNTPDGISTTNGKMIYLKQVGADIATIFSLPPEVAALLNISPIREERWQLVDNLPSIYPIINIITPSSVDNIYWPDPLVFDDKTTKRAAPYTVDLRVKVNPIVFGHPDINGSRFFRIKDCIVVRKPYVGILDFANLLQLDNLSGTLNIEGGLVFEDDGTTPYNINGKQATLNNFIHQTASTASTPPTTDDSIDFDNIEFTWKPNVAVLAGHNLTTIGCIPTVSIEKSVQNAIILAEGIEPVAVKLPPVSPDGFLPDVLGAQKCVSDALANFRQDVSPEGAALFQQIAVTCLTTLRDQTSAALCNAIIAAVSQFKSTIMLDNDVQFTTRKIEVTVVLNDPSGTSVSNRIPETCVPIIESKLLGYVTLGTITSFKYDGIGAFKAEITSDTAGSGEISVSFDGKVFNKTIADINTNTAIAENLLEYQFVDANVTSPVRRDETDVTISGEV
jgi:hypothetical protein